MELFHALRPLDEHNQQLRENVHPESWTNPTPSGRYNLVVVGAGTAGLVTAAGAAGLGAKVALVERSLMGGDCLNVGCVPSKALLSAARAAHSVRSAGEFGVTLPGGANLASAEVDFPLVMERMRKLRAGISPHDSAQRFTDLGVDVFLGDATFTATDKLRVNDQELQFKRAVIATGGRASLPAIPGIESIDALTNETLFSLTELPKHLLVIGGGPIGAEMAQAFVRFGSRVTLLERAEHILSREDPDAAKIVQQSLQSDGVEVVTQATIKSLELLGERRIANFSTPQGDQTLEADQVLVSIGRIPNVDGLGLDAAQVAYDQTQGVQVDDRLRSTNPRIFAAGDVASRFKFTHAADFMARTVIQNALFLGRAKVSSLIIPWSTYTSPELAHVGWSPKSNSSSLTASDVDTYTQPLDGVDRALLDGRTNGFVRIHTAKGTDKMVGATVVSEHAGDLISEITVAMRNGVGLKGIASSIHPYPTLADAIRKVGDQYSRTRLTPSVKRAFEKWLRWTR